MSYVCKDEFRTLLIRTKHAEDIRMTRSPVGGFEISLLATSICQAKSAFHFAAIKPDSLVDALLILLADWDAGHVAQAEHCPTRIIKDQQHSITLDVPTSL